MPDDKSPLQHKADMVRQFWYRNLPADKKFPILEAAFNKHHPTHESKRDATKRYDDAMGDA